jgi:hypothetical protein
MLARFRNSMAVDLLVSPSDVTGNSNGTRRLPNPRLT